MNESWALDLRAEVLALLDTDAALVPGTPEHKALQSGVMSMMNGMQSDVYPPVLHILLETAVRLLERSFNHDELSTLSMGFWKIYIPMLKLNGHAIPINIRSSFIVVLSNYCRDGVESLLSHAHEDMAEHGIRLLWLFVQRLVATMVFTSKSSPDCPFPNLGDVVSIIFFAFGVIHGQAVAPSLQGSSYQTLIKLLMDNDDAAAIPFTACRGILMNQATSHRSPAEVRWILHGLRAFSLLRLEDLTASTAERVQCIFAAIDCIFHLLVTFPGEYRNAEFGDDLEKLAQSVVTQLASGGKHRFALLDWVLFLSVRALDTSLGASAVARFVLCTSMSCLGSSTQRVLAFRTAVLLSSSSFLSRSQPRNLSFLNAVGETVRQLSIVLEVPAARDLLERCMAVAVSTTSANALPMRQDVMEAIAERFSWPRSVEVLNGSWLSQIPGDIGAAITNCNAPQIAFLTAVAQSALVSAAATPVVVRLTQGFVDDKPTGTMLLKCVNALSAQLDIQLRAQASSASMPPASLAQVIRSLRTIAHCVRCLRRHLLPPQVRAVLMKSFGCLTNAVSALRSQLPAFLAEQLRALLWHCVSCATALLETLYGDGSSGEVIEEVQDLIVRLHSVVAALSDPQFRRTTALQLAGGLALVAHRTRAPAVAKIFNEVLVDAQGTDVAWLDASKVDCFAAVHHYLLCCEVTS